MTDDDGYTNEPTHVRVWHESGEWMLDGVDNALLHYTEAIWTYDTRDEAVAAIGEFIDVTTDNGVEWKWDAQRRCSARHTNMARALDHKCG